MEIYNPNDINTLGRKYSDTKEGTYVHPDDDPKTASPVSNPNGNINLDESHRDMTDEKFRPEFSNLDNTYFFSGNGHQARHRFWGAQYAKDFSYRNSNADIEDPIFTGFTLSIDKLNSPLFYTIGEYDGAADGRIKNDGSEFSRNIADQIENCLKNNHSSLIRAAINSYDIAAILVKDKYPGDDAEIGYGMQHNVYEDGLPYGATEYIYMVDKMIKDHNTSQDTRGHFSLGDGSKNIAAETLVKSISDLENDLSLQQGESDTQNNIMEKTKTEHENNKTDYENKSQKLKELEQKRSDLLSDINQLKKVSSGGKSESFKHAVELKLQDNLRNIINAVVDLKPDGNSSTHTRSEYDEIVQNINNLDSTLQDLINEYNNKPQNVQSLITNVTKEQIEVKSCKIETKEPTDSSSYKNLPIEGETSTYDGSEAYKKGGKYNNLTVTVETEVKDKESSEADKRIKEKRSELEALDKEEEKLRKEYEESKNKFETDDYTQAKSKKDEADSNIEGLNQTIESLREDEVVKTNGTEQISKEAELYTGDYSPSETDDATFQNERKMKLARAPQTVYDILGFIRGMTRLTTEYPYLMQTITGLDEAYKNNYVVKDSFRGSGDNKITINIYESLDLKVSGMFNKYFNAAYDAQYRRERLPVNLRRFNCSVFVHDIRNFHLMTTNLGKSIRNAGKQNIPKIIEIALNSLSAIEFKFFGCEIVPEETGSIFDNVSNAERGDMRMTNFTFTYSDCVINYLPFEDMKNNLLKDLRDKGPHRPYVSVSKGVNKSKKELQFPSGVVPYEMNNKSFDAKKPRLKGLSNVYDGKDKEYDDYIVDFTGELDGLEGHNTRPGGQPTIPEGFAKQGYHLNSPLGNVNFNDLAVDRSRTEIDTENLKGINAQYNNGFVSGIGAVDLQDGEKEIISGIGNVNDDDYEEFENLINRRNQNVANKDAYTQTQADLQSFYSSSENYLQTRAEFDRIFRHFASSVSASTGIPMDNVYRAYFDEIEHIIFPGLNTPTVNRLGNIYPNLQELPEVEDLGDVLPDDVTEPKVTGIGNVYPDLKDLPNVKDLGDVLPDDITDPKVENIGNVYPILEDLPNVKNLGDILPDDIFDPKVKEIGNVYPNLQDLPNVKDLGDVLPDDITDPKIKEIGNVYPNLGVSEELKEIGNIYPENDIRENLKYIGDVIEDEKNLPNVKYLENIYPNMSENPRVNYIDDIIPDNETNNKIEQLGNIYPNLNNNDKIKYLGDVIPNETNPELVKELENIYPDQNQGEIIRELEDVIPDDNLNNKVKEIGNVYPNLNNNKIVEDLGDVLPNDENPELIKELENIYPNLKDREKIKYIDDIIPDDKNKDNIEKLGKVNLYDDEKKPIKELGNVEKERN